MLAAPALADSGPKKAYTAADQARAKAIVLRQADLPAGWKSEPASGGGGNLTCPGFQPKQSDLTKTGHADSSFTRPGGLVFTASTVGIFESVAQAQASWDRVVRPGLLGCLASFVANAKTKASVVSQGTLAFPALSDRAAAFRVVAAIKAQSATFKAYVDVVLEGSGRADVAMIFVFVVAPPDPVLERRLAAAVAGRLKG